MSETITKLRRRQGVVRSSITRLEKRVSKIERASGNPETPSHAHEMLVKLNALDTEFHTHHMELIDSVNEEVLQADGDFLEKEQDIIDEHDDIDSDIRIRLNRFESNTNSTSSTNSGNIKIA